MGDGSLDIKVISENVTTKPVIEEDRVRPNRLWLLPIALIWLVALGFYAGDIYFPFGMMGGLATGIILSMIVVIYRFEVNDFLGA